MLCKTCGNSMLVGPHEVEASEGVSHHTSDWDANMIDYELDADHTPIAMNAPEEVAALFKYRRRDAALEVFSEDLIDSAQLAFMQETATMLDAEHQKIIWKAIADTVRDYVNNHYFGVRS